MKREEINIRDPFVLVYDGKYYLYGTRGATCWGEADGFDCYVGTDLEEFDGPFDFTEDDMRVTQYFERCMLKELQDKVAILQKAIEILRTDKTA